MNNLRVEILNLDQLTQEEQDEFGGDTWYTYLKVSYKDKLLFLSSDYMEVEDATFSRDLGWIPGLLEEVYKLGLQDHE